MKISELATILGGKVIGEDATFSGVSIDSRNIKQGNLFIAIAGEKYNGHQFIAHAREKGAMAAVVSQVVSDPLPQIVVADTRLALGEFAKWWRNQFQIPVLAITGSSGKTTVKEMLTSIMKQSGNVLSTQGNLNNDFGVPLTLLQLNKDHQYAVIEMGANHPGEITYVASLASPQISVITNVAPAHLAGFGSIEGVAKAKGEIYQALPADGTAVINADDIFADLWMAKLEGRRINCYSLEKISDPQRDFYAANLAANEEGFYFFLMKCPLGQTTITLPLPGKHMVANALAAAACAYAAGASLANIKIGLEQVSPVKGRLCIKTGIKDAKVIDDTYNANPGSVKAALEVLIQSKGQTILVLGDMGELGEESAYYHRWVGEQARALGVNKLYGCGPMSELAVTGFGTEGYHFSSQADLITALLPELTSGTVVLVKGSRSSKMENVVAALVQEDKVESRVQMGNAILWVSRGSL